MPLEGESRLEAKIARLRRRFRFLPVVTDLEPYLRKFAKPGKEGEKVRMPRYHLGSSFGLKFTATPRFHTPKLYRDAEFNFVLYSGPWFYPLGRAVIGFNVFVDMETKLLTARVRQIQAIRRRGDKDPVPGLRWEKMLLEIVIDYAKKNGIECVEVSSAKANRWAASVPRERLVLRYDVVAKRRGFIPDVVGDVFRLRIA